MNVNGRRVIVKRLVSALFILTLLGSGRADAVPAGVEMWRADRGEQLMVDPAGGRLYVVGPGLRAYSARTGHLLWTAGGVRLLAVASGGDRVYSTGPAGLAGYDAVSGEIVWAPDEAVYSGAGLALAPDGSLVFLLMQTNDGWSAVATYDAASGARVWSARALPGTPRNADIAVSPDGSVVSIAREGSLVALDATNGARLWGAQMDGAGDCLVLRRCTSVAFSPDGEAVFAAVGSDWNCWWNTYAFDARSGAIFWHGQISPPDPENPFSELWCGAPIGIVLSADGERAFIAGSLQDDYVTVAIDAYTGDVVWSARYDDLNSWVFGSDVDRPSAIALSPDGARVYVTGSGDPTIAYDARTGLETWRRTGIAYPLAMAVHPDGGSLFITGGETTALGTGRCAGRYVDEPVSAVIDVVVPLTGPASTLLHETICALAPDS
jgi:DNA-binding beta-propeller fold protein YncE